MTALYLYLYWRGFCQVDQYVRGADDVGGGLRGGDWRGGVQCRLIQVRRGGLHHHCCGRQGWGQGGLRATH